MNLNIKLITGVKLVVGDYRTPVRQESNQNTHRNMTYSIITGLQTETETPQCNIITTFCIIYLQHLEDVLIYNTFQQCFVEIQIQKVSLCYTSSVHRQTAGKLLCRTLIFKMQNV